jgi:hypothetical protein
MQLSYDARVCMHECMYEDIQHITCMYACVYDSKCQNAKHVVLKSNERVYVCMYVCMYVYGDLGLLHLFGTFIRYVCMYIHGVGKHRYTPALDPSRHLYAPK